MDEAMTAACGNAWDLLDEEVVRFASELIRIDTTNSGGGDCWERPAAEYVAERLGEVGLRPQILESAPGRANVVVRIPGRNPGLPALLIHGHLDVVPADPRDWSVHPFSGEVRDGEVWGRGAIDMKDSTAKVTALARLWSRIGVRPQREVVLAFTADEEDSAAYGAHWLVDRHPELFEGCTEGISESGAYTFHARTSSGDAVRLYPVGVGERGSAWLRLTARGTAGHGSKPNPDNAVAALAQAVARIGEHRWPLRLTPATRASLTEICAALEVKPDFGADSGLGEAEVERILGELGGAAALLRPVLRNSANPSTLEAGYKINVIPETAAAGVDGRVVPGGAEEFTATLDRLTGPRVDWAYVHHSPPVQSPVDTPAFAAMRAAVEAHDPGGSWSRCA